MLRGERMREITSELVRTWLPEREDNSYKGTYGQVLLIGGSSQMTGAIILAARACVHAGAGLTTVATNLSGFSAVHSAQPEMMCVDMHDTDALTEQINAADTILIGPGLGRSPQAKAVFQHTWETVSSHQTFIIDADGLYYYAQLDHQAHPAQLILTPHLGEWERITGLAPGAQDLSQNKTWRDQLDATIVLKQHRTEVYCSDHIWMNTAGNPGMATGGMGDTLAGMIAGLSGQYTQLSRAVLSAVFLHSTIADELYRTQYVVLPSRLIDAIPETMRSLHVSSTTVKPANYSLWSETSR